MSTKFNVPTRSEVSDNNKATFDEIEKGVGFVPNIFASLAHSETALNDYLALSNRKSSLDNKEKEVINLVVSQINGCRYCQSAHTAIAKNNGFNDDQILSIRGGEAPSNETHDALAKFVKSITDNRGKADASALEGFYAAGYNHASLVDVILAIADKTVTNFLARTGEVEIDFPVAPELEGATA
ncbi:MAG: carboxymuconolactone decarboxylase family protein [Cyclobacteriaceae bacterium]